MGINQDPTLGTPLGAARKQAYAGAESVTSLKRSTPPSLVLRPGCSGRWLAPALLTPPR